MDKEKITSFMLTLGLMQDQVSDIHQRVQASQNYTEELLGALYPANVFLPETAGYSSWINKYLLVSRGHYHYHHSVSKHLPLLC